VDDDLEFTLTGPVAEMFELILFEAAGTPGPPSKIEAPLKQAFKEVRAVYPDLPSRVLDFALGRAYGRLEERLKVRPAT
jgi:hypothetical protein